MGQAAGDQLLRLLSEAVEAETGESFFRLLVRGLAQALGVRYAFVSELTRGGTHFRSLALWARGGYGENFEVPLAGTPCEAVVAGRAVFHPDRLQERFPADRVLVDWGAVSYGGVPVADSRGAVVGHLAYLHDRPLPGDGAALDALRIIARRAAAEVERRRAEEALRARDELLSAVLSAVPDGIAVFDAEGAIAFASASAQRGLGEPELVGSSVFRFTTPPGEKLLREAMGRLARGEGPPVLYVTEPDGIRGRRADGSQFPFEATLALDRQGASPRFVLVWRDLEQRHRAERDAALLRREAEYLREELRELHPFEEIVGRSPGLAHALSQVERVARTQVTVLITGETGTGKELVARAIHAGSPRAGRALVKLNCAALPEGLVESELFGHERGAFTGASQRRLGRFSLADGGTLFLDEVGELPLAAQSKLLRVLQDGEFERVGGATTLRVDVRVLAATNRDLDRAVREGAFREDLFYRLNVFPLALPPLRERPGDIALLAQYFAARHAPRIGRQVVQVSPPAMERLASYPWPGNVRELESIIERALVLAPDGAAEIGAELVEALLPGTRGGERAAAVDAPGPSATLQAVERRHVLDTLRAHGWRIEGAEGAARSLGLAPSTLRSRMQSLGIRRPEPPRAAPAGLGSAPAD